MIETIEWKHQIFPKYQASGNAARFIIPFALEVCKGKGYDIGYGKEEWKFPGAIGIDISDNYIWNSNILPDEEVDYIFSSHCLEHITEWMMTLDFWISKIKSGGVLFLYLPDRSQSYWTFGNKKHVNVFDSKIITDFM